jgi:uncharacterized membrane protein YfcA
MLLLLIFLAGLWAGIQNTLAGGGSFVTLPALILSGMSPLAANITSTVALFPGQLTSGYAGRKLVSGAAGLSFRTLFVLSVIGGAAGGLLLLHTSPKVFARLVPWLVLFATAVFTWGSFFRKGSGREGGPPGRLRHRHGAIPDRRVWRLLRRRHRHPHDGGADHGRAVGAQRRRHQERAGRRDERLGGRPVPDLARAALAAGGVLAAGAILGGLAGTWALHRVNEKALRVAIVCIGVALTVGLFLRPL